jgi:hypothetical protein
LLQYLRVRDRRMLLLAALFAFQAQALAREWWDVWRDVYQAGVCAAGLALLLALAPPSRHPATDARRHASAPPPDPEPPPEGARDLAPR